MRPPLRGVSALGVALLCLVWTVLGQQPQGVPLSGRVVDGSTGAPIEGASVRVSGSSSTASVLSDPKGQFVIPDTGTGRVFPAATKNGWTGGRYGQRFPGDSDVPLEIAQGAAVTPVVLKLWPKAILAGRVIDDAGDGLVGVTVHALRHTVTGGRERLVTEATAKTDDRGEFRMTVMPGAYVAAVPSSTAQRWTSAQSRTAAHSFATTFDSGRAIPTSADLNEVGPGGQLPVVTIRVAMAKAGGIAGRLSQPVQPPARARLRLVSADSNALPHDIPVAESVPLATGEYTFPSVPPGDYRIRTLVQPVTRAAPMVKLSGTSMQLLNMIPGRSPIPPMPEDPTLWADELVSVGREPLTNVVVNLWPGLRVKGRFVFDEGSAPKPTPDQLSASFVALASHDGDDAHQLAAQIAPDGTFSSAAVPPGDYSLSWFLTFPGWSATGVDARGVSFSHRPIAIRDQSLDEFVVTLSDKTTSVSGSVLNDRNEPGSEASVYLFPSDPALWTKLSQTMKEIRVARDGRYTIRNPLPGDYHLIAVDGLAREVWTTKHILSALAGSAATVSVAKGNQVTRDLRPIAAGSLKIRGGR